MMRKKLFNTSVFISSLLLLLSGLIPIAAAQLPEAAVVHANQAELSELARGQTMGGHLKLIGIPIEGETADTLELERFQVFTPDAKIVVDDAYTLPPPDHAYFRGIIQGEPENVAVLVIPASGEPEGLIMGPKGIWKIEKEQGASSTGLKGRKLKEQELAALKDFKCATDSLGLDLKKNGLDLHELVGGNSAESSLQTSVAETTAVSYTSRVAVETDYEFYARFNNVNNATSYVGALFAYISGIYVAETATSLNVSYLRLWTGGSGSDPWTVTSGTSNALNEFRNYWNANMGQVNRTIAHMLSGKGLGGGVAWLGVLCNNSYGYGLSASLSRTTLDTTKTVWDTMVVAHEIGHNFNSPHTQGYCNIGGNADPVDLCYQGEGNCSGRSATGLPGTNSLTGGSAGAGNGTIMSYCHLVSGGYGNIAMTFGISHPYGVLADRVPNRMAAYVQSRAQSYPSCLEPIVDGFLLTVEKTGSGTVTSDPSGISCGTDCSQNYAPGTPVTLTASAAAGSHFGGWSGNCSGSNASVSVSMDANKTCTATFIADVNSLTVNKAGTGSGAVTSNPAGISCGTDCSQSYTAGSSVSLIASADNGSQFVGWSGACAGTSASTAVLMDTSKSCTATSIS